jgi:hypothetical protein
LRRTGGNINRDLKRQKHFKNPDLLPRLITTHGICEIGSNFEPSKFDPFKWEASSFFKALAVEQAKQLDEEKAKEKEREEKEKESLRGALQGGKHARVREERARERGTETREV